MKDVRESESRPARSARQAPDHLAPQVLLVDDDEAVGKHAALHLRRAGYRVTVAGTGAQAMTAIARTTPDVVILDHFLPDTTGEELLATLRANEATATIPVIYLTVDGSRRRFRASMTGGADDFLSKPFKPAELRSAVAAQLLKVQARLMRRPESSPGTASEEVRRLAEDLRALESRLAVAYEEKRRTEIQLAVLNASIDHRVERQTRALAEQNAALRSYGYTLAHELRRPLRGILGFAGILRESADIKDDSAAMLARIETSGRHMGEFIEGILELASIDRGPLRCESVDLSAMAGDVVTGLRPTWPRTRVTIAPGLVADANPTLARIVLENLLSNACKYSAGVAAPEVTVEASRNGDGREFCVRDNGTGFAGTEASRVFEPFVRLAGSTGIEGMGIGLATVRQAIERHGGRIRAEGNPGAGACFYFDFGDQAKREAR